MPLFDYHAAKADGKTERGSMEAADEAAVTALLRAGGRYPVKIRRRAEESALLQIGARVPPRKLAAFCLQFSAMLEAGVALEPSLDMCARQAEDKRLRRALTEALSDIRGGRGLLDAFRRRRGRFPEIFLNMVEAGEASGTLGVCMRRAGEGLARSSKISAKVRGAMVYPAFLLILMVIILAFMTVYVIPRFVGLYENRGAQIPALTAALIALSGGVRDYGLYWLLGGAALFALWHFWLTTERGRVAYDRFRLRIPLFGKLSSAVMASRYARAMAALGGAGVPLTRALEVAGRSTGNRYAQKMIGGVIAAVKNGSPVSGPLEKTGIFPPLLTHMTRMGEESGRMEELLGRAADFFEDESEAAAQRLVALLEPGVIVVMGGFVLLMALAIVVPMFNMYSLM